MEKHLTVVGNGLALLIDKSMRDLLGITRDTRLRISTDGRRLVLEPLPPEAEKPDTNHTPLSVQLDALPVARALIDRHLMGAEQFKRISVNSNARLGAYLGWVENGNLERATAEERTTMMRMQTCLRHLDEGMSWDAAIAAAISSCPA